MEKRPFEPFSPRASEKLQSKPEQKPLERQIKFISKLQCWLVWGIYFLKGCCCQKRTYSSSLTSSCVTGMPTDTLSMKEDGLCEWKKHLFCQACANKTCSVLEVDHQNSLIESGIGQNKSPSRLDTALMYFSMVRGWRRVLVSSVSSCMNVMAYLTK